MVSHLIPRLLVVGSPLTSQAVGGLLSELFGLELCGVCACRSEAWRIMQQAQPDLLILDALWPVGGWRALAALLPRYQPEGRFVLLNRDAVSGDVPSRLEPLLLAGLNREHSWSDLLTSVEGWRQQRLRSAPPCHDAAALPLDRLSPREMRVFRALGTGLVNKQIALRLGLSLNTVETYRKSLSAKLRLSGAELVRAATLHRCCTAACSTTMSIVRTSGNDTSGLPTQPARRTQRI